VIGAKRERRGSHFIERREKAMIIDEAKSKASSGKQINRLPSSGKKTNKCMENFLAIPGED